MLMMLVECWVTHKSFWINLPMETVILDEMLAPYAPMIKSYLTNVEDLRIQSASPIIVLNFIMQMLTGFEDTKNRFDDVRLDLVKRYLNYEYKLI